MLTRSFFFVRHGETDWNRQGLIQGHTDIPLNETGRQQAQESISIFSRLPIARIVCSDLSRAYETATIINAVLQKPLHVDEGLKERNFGDFEGVAVEDLELLKQRMIDEGLPPEENGYPCPARGEPYGDFRRRTLEAIARNLQVYPGENLLFVAHGGLYRVLRRCLFSDIDRSPNVKPYHFEKKGQEWFLIMPE